MHYYADSTLIKEITRLGIQYNLLTKYTSFIAIDSLIRRDTGDVVTVKQPLPLPEGVSDYAVGENMTTSGWGTTGMSSQGNGKSYTNYVLGEAGYCDSCSFIDYTAPNPFPEYTIIRFHIAQDDDQEIKGIEVFDYFGKKVFQEDLSSYGQGWHSFFLRLEHNLTALPAGIYYVKLKVGNRYVSSLRICKI